LGFSRVKPIFVGPLNKHGYTLTQLCVINNREWRFLPRLKAWVSTPKNR
jgi:hypothetical protein